VLLDLQRFVADNERLLPQAAVIAIRSFVNERENLFKEAAETSNTKEERGRAVLVLLAALETQISFLLSDNQPALRARFELAMSHLQRSIAVDEDLRSKWLTAFEEGEPACEKRGAVHLLSHGIWAFKVQAGRAITDLVFPNRAEEVPAYAMGLVELTGYRYAVIVVKEQCKAPADVTIGQIIYRPVILAVEPLRPSDVARKRNSNKGKSRRPGAANR
jgi:hypothetical protein